MIENASDLTKILETIDPSWGKFGSPSTRDTLFGEDFQSSLIQGEERYCPLKGSLSHKGKQEGHPIFYQEREAKKWPFSEGALLRSTGAGRARASFRAIHNLTITEKENLAEGGITSTH